MSTTVGERLRHASEAYAERLTGEAGGARFDVELLMAAALGTDRSGLLLRHMRAPAPDAFEPLFARLMCDEPVAYILGSAEFYGLTFEVGPDVLIPRADSETAIEAARAAFATTPPARVLDCGTGSGALLLTALHLFPEALGVAIDRSAPALAIATTNAERLGLAGRARFHHRDWEQTGWSQDLGGPFDLVLANPPYIEDAAELDVSVRGHEPHGALFAGPDGLDAYRILIPQLPELLCENGIALVEIGYRQAEAVTELGEACRLDAKLHRDLAGRPRIVAFSRILH